MKIHTYLFILASGITTASCVKSSELNPPDPAPAETRLNVSYGTSSEQTMDIYLPAGRNTVTTKVMVMIHGGGWNAGDKSDMTPFTDTIHKRLPDYAVFNINYRLAAGANLFPAQENDVKTAVQFIMNNAGTYGVSQKLVLLGVSAGAHLALLQGYKYASQIKPKAIVSFFGPTDLIDMYRNPLNPLIAQGLLSIMGKTPTQDSLLYANGSPVNFVSSTSSPTILLHGGLDPLVTVTQATVLKAKLDAAGITNQFVYYPTEGHGWLGANLYDSFNKIEAFLKANVN